jgi:hypothetical protein
MTITTTGRNKYRAHFNRRHIQITTDGTLTAADLSTGELIAGDELRSVKSLVQWHVQTKQDSNELPTLWTVRK